MKLDTLNVSIFLCLEFFKILCESLYFQRLFSMELFFVTECFDRLAFYGKFFKKNCNKPFP